MSFAWWLSFFVGFLSLSQEILFVRLISFAQGGTPPAFAIVLTLYLLGIALGAAVGKVLCARTGSNLYAVATIVLLLAAATDPLAPLLGQHIGLQSGMPGAEAAFNAFVTVGLVVGAAAIKSVLFPIAHHLGSQSTGPRVGSSVSRIYFGNILGSTLGPVVTGYFLLDWLSIDHCFLFIGGGCLVLALACAWRAGPARHMHAALALGSCALLATALANQSGGFVQRTAKRDLLPPAGQAAPSRIAHVIENRHGIIHTVEQSAELGDIVYGGNMFDGRISVDTRHDSNGINRVYLLAGLHPAPARILVIGYSGGAWTEAASGFAGVERIDAIDINEGYRQLVGRYEQVAPLLRDRRVHLHTDDGRRWLKRHPNERYDLIIVNNTQHVRSYSSSLLSQEFFAEARRHLKARGILAVNATGSLDVALTALRSSPHSYRHASFILISDHDIRPSAEAARARYTAMQLRHHAPLTDADFGPGGAGTRLVTMATGLKPVSELFIAGNGPARVITDNNLVIEFRHGQRLDMPPLRWLLPARESSHIVD